MLNLVIYLINDVSYTWGFRGSAPAQRHLYYQMPCWRGQRRKRRCHRVGAVFLRGGFLGPFRAVSGF